MYGIHKQVHAPTGIEHCVYCNFFSPRESNLVVAGTTQLRVYRFITLQESKLTDEGQDEIVKKRKFELAGQYTVFGNIQSVNAVRLAGNSRESLLLSFSDAKLSIVEYDPTTHDLKTVSLHYFEEEQLKNGKLQNLCLPKVRVDPERRCSAMLAYRNHLIILPFRQEGVMDEHGTAMSASDRSYVLPSYMIDMRLLDEKVTNIIDYQFLHGYYEPTILIIYEPARTCAGRLAIRQDTCALVAISLNMSEKVNPVIWSLSNLPYDCIRVEPVPKPLGGVLVFATNSLIYLNQSVPPFGVQLNSIADQSTLFQLRLQEGVVMTLDGSQSDFIDNDKLVLSLRGGEIYVLTLVSDGMRGIRGFNFDKAASSVLTSCMCQCGDGYLFLGSRLGNSLLLKYTEKKTEIGLFDTSISAGATEEEQPQNKRRKLEYDNPYALDDLDELEVYGSEKQPGTQLTSYAFEVCDSLLNIGPCTSVDMGEPAFISEEFTSNIDMDLELVTCSGYGKNGALSVLQKSVRPQVVTTFELPGCTDMWTVLCSDQNESSSEEDVSKKGYHSFLILSRVDSSMVLKTEQEIMELDHSGFSTQYPTVFAGNFGKDNYIMQVVPLGVRLLKGVEQIQHIPMDAGFSAIVWCFLVDPYAVLLTVDGIMILVEFTEDSVNGPRLTVSKPALIHGSKVCSCCLYKDVSGLMSTEKVVSETMTAQQQAAAAAAAQSRITEPDDEDELLYGESMPSVFGGDEVKMGQSANQDGFFSEAGETESTIKPTYWCVLCRENGVLEIYSVPEFKLVFLVKNFNMAHRVLVDSGPSTVTTSSSSSLDESLMVKEVLLTGMGYKNSKPLLFAMVDQDLLIYEAFKFNEGIIDGNLNLRFKKLHHNLLVREKKSRLQKNKMAMESPLSSSTPRIGTFRTFSDVSSYSGVFVCGSCPYWLFMTNRGALRAHPMTIDGPVSSFAPFHNVNCPKGFLFFNKQGELRISVLPTHLSYDAPWPVRKVPLRATPHFAAYNRESKTFAVVSSQRETCKKICRQGPEEREFEETDRGPRFVYPLVDKFSVQLISPVSWEAIPNTKFEFDEFEHVTTMKNLLLRSEETHTGLKGFIAVGSTYVYGEDIQCKGRICIYDIIEVVPEPGQPLTKNKLKLVYGKEQKGPVTALEHIRGYVLSAIGQKIYIWNFKDNQDLIGMAFIDTQLYIHTAISIKNFVVVADIHKSIILLRFQEETKTLAHVSRDHGYMEVYSANYVVDGAQVGILASDSDKNLILYQYQPEALESMGGQRLLQRADIHLGSHVTAFFRIRVKGGKASEASKMKDLRQATYFGTLDGGLGLILPMPEKTYRRLLMLQSKLVDSIPHLAGLNPRAFRLLKWPRRPLSNPHRNILDSELLMKFLHLGVMERVEVAKKIGTTPTQILDDLMDVERVTAHF